METPIITEDYVPFYIAELLAEKGFDIPLKTAYNADKKAFETNELQNFNGTKNDYSRPTVQMALKWIRYLYVCVPDKRSQCKIREVGRWGLLDRGKRFSNLLHLLSFAIWRYLRKNTFQSYRICTEMYF